ncbi:dihydrofolate reductase [Halobacillus salinarum]|uniref:Dihydrofolate reductase n=1 Tax=Halobacillus salinarum TaxID=2932257 RepID=A0ABY4EE83_9BACI|nr:dihydrofolate reductase [Halobacillus salinarum]UOQ42773.1 dihydrofolate reductase [Halobacillus salinarum]
MISFVFAMDRNQLIGKNNDLPWYLPNDFKFFKETTWGQTIIMGRKTFESFGKPLPNREHVILTRSGNFHDQECKVVRSINEILTMEKENPEKEWFVIGGSVLFKEMMPYADKMYMTFIDEEFDGDTYFPSIDYTKWRLSHETKGKKDERNPYDYYFRIYQRVETE